MKYKWHLVVAVLVPFILVGCKLFTSHYDATRHENFTMLKAVHFKLFHDWSDESGNQWNGGQITTYCDQGYLRFREAHEFAKSRDKSDKTGQTAVRILWDQFEINCKYLLSMNTDGSYKKYLFNSYDRENMIPSVEKNYDFAIAGEEARVK